MKSLHSKGQPIALLWFHSLTPPVCQNNGPTGFLWKHIQFLVCIKVLKIFLYNCSSLLVFYSFTKISNFFYVLFHVRILNHSNPLMILFWKRSWPLKMLFFEQRAKICLGSRLKWSETFLSTACSLFSASSGKHSLCLSAVLRVHPRCIWLWTPWTVTAS